MYNKFYGFSEAPFNISPDPNFLYLTPDHREALSSMIYGIVERKGFITITGEVGTGKTTLIYALLKKLPEEVKTVFIFHTHLTFGQLIKNILQELELPTAGEGEIDLLRKLNEYLIERFSRGENLAIIIDEAQNLSKEVMEGLRMLSNLETSKAKLLQIVLVGQPELEAKLDSPDLRQLKQRIEIKRRIRPLTPEECRRYVDYRLNLVGSSSAKVFTPEALPMICAYGKGIPRSINIICDNAFLIGYAVSRKVIDADDIVKEVIRDLDSSKLEKPPCLEPTLDNLSQPSTLNSIILPESRDLKVPDEENISFLASFINEFGYFLKNKLSSIRNLTRLSIEKFDDAEFRKYFYRGVTEDIKKIDSVLNGLLNYIQINTPIDKADTVHCILEEVLEENRKQIEDRKIKIFKKFEKDLPEISIHEEKMKYILNSILQYAVLSIPPNGNIIFLTKSLQIQKGMEDGEDLSQGENKYIEILVVFGELKKSEIPFETKSRNSAVQKEEGTDLIFLLIKEVIERNEGVVKLEVDEKKQQTRISLRFPAERRKVVHYRPIHT